MNSTELTEFNYKINLPNSRNKPLFLRLFYLPNITKKHVFTSYILTSTANTIYDSDFLHLLLFAPFLVYNSLDILLFMFLLLLFIFSIIFVICYNIFCIQLLVVIFTLCILDNIFWQ